MWRGLLIAWLLSLTQVFGAEPEVTLPLSEYLKLKESIEDPKITLIEEVEFSGEFPKALFVNIKGKSLGQAPSKPLLQGAEALQITNCTGDSLLENQGYQYVLTPIGRNFNLKCELRVKNASELRVQVVNARYVSSKVKNVESLVQGDGSSGYTISFTRAFATAPSTAEITGDGRYHLIVYPNETRFDYSIRLENPHRVQKEFNFPLVNSEFLQNISSSQEYEERAKEKMIRFTLNPGTNLIRLSGRLEGSQFTPPLKSEAQFVLVESHPTLRLQIKDAGRRISIQESGMSPSFTNGRSYLASQKNSYSWTTTKLDVFQATGISVNNAHYQYYIPENGKPIVEAQFNVNNQGMPELPISVPGQITYLEVNGVAQILYKSPDNNLLVPLRQGTNEFMIQYLSANESRGIFARPSELLARPNVMMSNLSASILMPSKWSLLRASSMQNSQSEMSAADFAWALLVFVLMYWILNVGIGGLARFTLATTSAGATLIIPGLIWLFVFLTIISLAIRHRSVFFDYWKRKPILAGLSFALSGFVVLCIGFVALQNVQRPLAPSVSKVAELSSNASQEYDQVAAKRDANSPAALEEEGRGDTLIMRTETAGTAGNANDFQGVPARVQIPFASQSFYFSQSMIDSDKPISLRAFLISGAMWNSLVYFFLGILVLLYYRHRKDIAKWLKLSATEAT